MAEKPQGEPLTILLVEDNPAHAELVRRCFADHRIANRVYHVSTGEDALDFLHRRNGFADEQESPRPHLILLDLRLPGIDGMEVMEEVKQTDGLKRIPIVVLTTSSAETDVVGAYDRHANGYLVKPLDFVKFRKLMGDLGYYWLGWNRCPWNRDPS